MNCSFGSAAPVSGSTSDDWMFPFVLLGWRALWRPYILHESELEAACGYRTDVIPRIDKHSGQADRLSTFGVDNQLFILTQIFILPSNWPEIALLNGEDGAEIFDRQQNHI